MVAPRDLPHIMVPESPLGEAYRRPPRGGDGKQIKPPDDRVQHGTSLKHQLEEATDSARQRREQWEFSIPDAEPAIYVEVESRPDVPLNNQSLEDYQQGIEVVAVRVARSEEADGEIQRATVLVPEGKVGHFLKRFEAYTRTEPKKKRERRYESMIDPIGRLQLATLQGLWTDDPELFPSDDEVIWWEVWLRKRSADEAEIRRLQAFTEHQGLRISPQTLQFDDRIIALVQASPLQLSASIDLLDDVAEVRRPNEPVSAFTDMTPVEQAEWVELLRSRIVGPDSNCTAICLLDTGVNREHPLIEFALASGDLHAYDPSWGVNDDRGHGTEMAGLALYGDLSLLLPNVTHLPLGHRLESVKILHPKHGSETDPKLYGSVTAECVARVEIQAPQRSRHFAMTVTSENGRDRGAPTSWSASLDALAAGRAFDSHTGGLRYLDADQDTRNRLFIVSAGNVRPHQGSHLDMSDLEPVHDPAQAWNALTVGAATEKATIFHPDWNGFSPLSDAGDLSPWSSTSVSSDRVWPIKPDVLFEGGNWARDTSGFNEDGCPDLSLLTVNSKPIQHAFTTTNGTSASAALAAKLAAQVMSAYPSLWPETVRGVIVHSARWTQRMEMYFSSAKNKGQRAALVRRYGYGVVDTARTLHSAANAVTLISQAVIHPFRDGQLNEIHYVELPWPREVLEGLGSTIARLKVTLSYFVEPNPGRRGWQRRHRYASHGLRFEVKGPTESMGEFRKRLNAMARTDKDDKPSGGPASSDWYLGPNARDKGSIHSDVMETTAADLAERGALAVYPVTGWWKEQPKRDRSRYGVRYALLVSIETDEANVDLWTPIAEQVQTPIEIEADTSE